MNQNNYVSTDCSSQVKLCLSGLLSEWDYILPSYYLHGDERIVGSCKTLLSQIFSYVSICSTTTFGFIPILQGLNSKCYQIIMIRFWNISSIKE